ncbi:MAG: VWA domain-containing protein [Thermoflexales bacterium]|nr:VWA domain-containing protein [Thermoflexales bacterium]
MNERLAQFAAALRAAGVRVSLAESADAARAADVIGLLDPGQFRTALRATLIKEPADVKAFDELYPQFFGSVPAQPQPLGGLSDEERSQLQDAIEQLRRRIRELIEMLASGEAPSAEQMRQATWKAGLREGMRGNAQTQRWLSERLQRELGLTDAQLKEALEALRQQLEAMGMPSERQDEVEADLRANAEALREQISDQVGQSLRDARDDKRRRERVDALMDQPLNRLADIDADALRTHVRRLVARLRSRAALRMRRGKRGNFDVRGTLRESLRTAGVPFKLRHRRRRLKPRLVVLVDVSTSMRPVVDFLLRMVYEMREQTNRMRSFAFISDLTEISSVFDAHRPDDAVPRVLEMLPPGHYNTDLGNSLHTLTRDHMDAVDRRVTLIVVGDGRNNYNDPRVDILALLRQRARRVIWMNPEPPGLWATGDSDMAQYAPHCSAVLEVATLRQLAEAVDGLFTEIA